jgi:hypothetical protein
MTRDELCACISEIDNNLMCAEKASAAARLQREHLFERALSLCPVKVGDETTVPERIDPLDSLPTVDRALGNTPPKEPVVLPGGARNGGKRCVVSLVTVRPDCMQVYGDRFVFMIAADVFLGDSKSVVAKGAHWAIVVPYPEV